MTTRAQPQVPLHIAEQRAAALLPPVGAALAELEERLARYVQRLRMGDADRALVDEARAAVAQVRDQLDQLAARAASVGSSQSAH